MIGDKPTLRPWFRFLGSFLLALGLMLILGWALLPQPVSSLPPDPNIQLQKNPTYYDDANVSIDSATSYFIDGDEAWDRYQTGELDSIGPPDDALADIKASPVYGPQLHVVPRSCTYYYGFSHDVPPFDNPLVRAAFASAIDRPRMINEAAGGDPFPAITFAPPGVFGHVDGYAQGIGRPYAPALAAQLLADSGYTGDPPITLMYPTSSYDQGIAESIRQIWIETLGITVNLEDLPWYDYLDFLSDGSAEDRPGIWRLRWCSDYPDAHNWHHDAMEDWIAHLARYDSPDYFDLVDAAATETDPATRLDLYKQAEAQLTMTDTAMAPLYYYVGHTLTRPDLDRTYPPSGGERLQEWSFTGAPRDLEIVWGSPGSIDPALSWNWDVVNQLFLGLTRLDVDGSVIPELATSWDISPDGRVYTFTLRNDAVWSDGHPVTAHDVEYGILRTLHPQTRSETADYLRPIENAWAFHEGEITDPDLVGVEALDDTHVRFILTDPGAYFPSILTMPPARPQPQWAIEAHSCGWTAPENIVSNGPYRLTAWEGPSHIGIEKWADGEPRAGEEFVYYIRYLNKGGDAAEDTTLTDTLSDGQVYLSDDSGFPHTGTGTEADPIVWDLGDLPAHSCGEFTVTVLVTARGNEEISNRVQIATTDPNDQAQEREKESEWRGRVQQGPWMRVNYAHDWVGGNYPPGHQFTIEVMNASGQLKATAHVESTEDGGWGDGFETRHEDWTPSQPDIEPGDKVRFRADDGYDNTIEVGVINGDVDSDNDSVGGTILAPWFSEMLDVECHSWGAPDHAPNKESTAMPDGSSPYFCQWDPDTEWDMQPGQDVAVMYWEPDGDMVINVLQEPVPDMRIEKRSPGSGEVMPDGPVVFELQYRNDGEAMAETITLTDTLPANTTYVDDSSGVTPAISGNQVVWTLGPLEPNQERRFHLLLNNSAQAGDTLRNQADISAPFDDPDQDGAEVHVVAGQPDLSVRKDREASDPTPGQTFLYRIDVNNDSSIASGEVTLTDTLPQGTSVVSWFSDNGYGLWSEVSRTGGELILQAPTLPGHWHDRIMLRLLVDADVEIDTELTNTVEVHTENDANPDNNFDQRDDRVNWPRWDVGIDKRFGWGELFPGGEIGYNIHFRNHGSMATAVTLTDMLPAGVTLERVERRHADQNIPFPPDSIEGRLLTWDIGVMEPGERYDLNLRLRINNTVVPDFTLTNCAAIDNTPDQDDNPGNNRMCTLDVVANFGPNLRVTKEHDWRDHDRQLRYRIRIENVGNTEIEDVEVVDTYPESTHFNGDWWHHYHRNIELEHNPATRQLTWTLERMRPGDGTDIEFVVDLDESVIGEQGLSFVNLVEAPLPDDVYPDNNTYEDTALTGPDLFVRKWVSDGEIKPGERITMMVQFGNMSQHPWYMSDDTHVRLAERLPAGMSFVASQWPDGSPFTPFFNDPASGIVLWTDGRLGSDDERWFHLVVDLAPDLEPGDVLINNITIAQVLPLDIDPNPDNNSFDYPVRIPTIDIYLPMIVIPTP